MALNYSRVFYLDKWHRTRHTISTMYRYKKGEGYSTVWSSSGATDNSYFTFTLLEDGTYSIAAANPKNMPTELIIPSEYEGKPITQVADYAFVDPNSTSYNQTTKRIVIPDSIITIGSFAFAVMLAVTEITLGANLVNIGENAFQYCISLTNITIPDSVTSIGQVAFAHCNKLRNVNIPDSVTSIGSNAFLDCSSLESVVIGSGVTSIGSSAFTQCNSLTAIYITDLIAWCSISFESQGSNPLYYAKNLYLNGELVTELIIPNDITEIKNYAFYNCKNFTSITIPDSVTSIGGSAFYGCSVKNAIVPAIAISSIPRGTSLESITITSGSSIPESAFKNCRNLSNVVLSDTITSIGFEAFRNCSSLAEITLPFVGATKNGTENTHFGYIFGASSYSNNRSYVPSTLENVTITSGEISNSAFEDCDSLVSVVIGDSVTKIGNDAFRYCSNLTSMVISDSVTFVSNSAFSQCSSLRSITIDENNQYYKSIDGNLYSKDGKTLIQYAIGKEDTSFEILFGVTSIASNAFSSCSSLESVDIPDSVTSIGQYAFAYCTSLISVVIGDGVATIDSYTFDNCNSLVSVVIGDSVTKIGNDAFRYCSSLTDIVIPDGVTSIGDVAFSRCSNLTSVVIPDSVTSIGNSAFSDCPKLTIYCEAESQPDGWHIIWKPSNCPVVWGYNLIGDEYLTFTELEDGTCSVKATDVSNLPSEIGIPFSYNGKAVTAIENSAFINASNITKVIIPNGINVIGDYAFYGCSNLISITIPDSVSYIGHSAFYNTAYYNDTNNWVNDVLYIDNHLIKAKTSVSGEYVVKDSTVTIGYQAFYNCTNLTSITIPDSVVYIGEEAFYNTAYYNNESNWVDGVLYIGNHLIRAKGTISGDYTIKDGTITIAEGAFFYCKSLTGVIIPNSVTYIGNYAFGVCDNLVINCKATSQPSGWHDNWNPSDCPVVWGYTG